MCPYTLPASKPFYHEFLMYVTSKCLPFLFYTRFRLLIQRWYSSSLFSPIACICPSWIFLIKHTGYFVSKMAGIFLRDLHLLFSLGKMLLMLHGSLPLLPRSYANDISEGCLLQPPCLKLQPYCGAYILTWPLMSHTQSFPPLGWGQNLLFASN